MTVTLEQDPHPSTAVCGGCGREHDTVRGYLYRNRDAWIAYWASLYGGGSHRAEPTVVLTLAVADDWSDDANTRGRCWAQLDLWADGNEIRMSFIDPVGLLDQAHFGSPLTRVEVLQSTRKAAFLEAAERVSYDDDRVAALLGNG